MSLETFESMSILEVQQESYCGYTRIICNPETYIQQFTLQQIFKPTTSLYLTVLTHYIILVTYLPINFHVFIIQQSMSQMRLRHKKPINSYVGQGNYDSNQVHDEDFAKNAMQNKKVRLMKQRPSSDQTKKYAEILCQFVNAVNQDYRNHTTLFTVPKQVSEKELDKLEAIDNLAANKIIKDNSYVKSQEVVSKQQQKIRKSENNINKLSLTKKIKKEKILVQEQPKIREIRENQNKIVNTINVETKPPLPINSKQPSNVQRGKIQPPQASTANLNPNPSQNNLPSIEQIQQLQQMQQQQLFQSQIMAMNSGLYSMYPYPMSQYVNYQMFMEQLKNNPYMPLQNMMGMFPPGITNNYIPFSKLPFPRNGQPEQKKQDANSSLKNEKQLQNPLNNIKNQHPHQNIANQQKTIHNFGNIQPQTLILPKNSQNSIKKQSSDGTIQPIDFKRKSCYHIAIAYSIHFARLKENGLLNQATTEQGYMKLDPTFPARRVRNHKHSDSTGR